MVEPGRLTRHVLVGRGLTWELMLMRKTCLFDVAAASTGLQIAELDGISLMPMINVTRYLPGLLHPEGAPPINRVTITDDEVGGFRVTIPARPNVPLILFLSLWLCGWLIGEILVPLGALGGIMMARDNGDRVQGFVALFLWFPFWTVGGLLMLLALLWNIAGREVITLSDATLCTKRALGTYQRSRSYDLAGIRNMRFAPLVYNPFSMSGSWQYQFQMLGVAGGSVAFDHGGKTYRFGNALPETESLRLIATIKQRFKIADDCVEPLPVRT